LAAIIFSLKNITNIGFRFFLWLQWKRICVVVSIQESTRCACLEQEVDKILVWSKKLKFVWYTEHLEAILCRHLVLTLPHIFSFIVIIEKT
jgi:hypothetical protein